jgi:uncharacterized membrane protein YqgA involved in biofilm formation
VCLVTFDINIISLTITFMVVIGVMCLFPYCVDVLAASLQRIALWDGTGSNFIHKFVTADVLSQNATGDARMSIYMTLSMRLDCRLGTRMTCTICCYQ